MFSFGCHAVVTSNKHVVDGTSKVYMLREPTGSKQR